MLNTVNTSRAKELRLVEIVFLEGKTWSDSEVSQAPEKGEEKLKEPDVMDWSFWPGFD